jgi:hypothetical protein
MLEFEFKWSICSADDMILQCSSGVHIWHESNSFSHSWFMAHKWTNFWNPCFWLKKCPLNCLLFQNKFLVWAKCCDFDVINEHKTIKMFSFVKSSYFCKRDHELLLLWKWKAWSRLNLSCLVQNIEQCLEHLMQNLAWFLAHK